MHNEETTIRPQDCVVPALVLGTAAFGTYQIVKLGFAWTVEGVRVFKSRKDPDYMLGYN